MSAIFSQRLIALRKEQGMTQEDLAKAIHRKRSTVSGYEVEGKEPDLDTVCAFASIFGVSTDYLLGFSSERNHVETVFFNDHHGFKEDCDALSPDLRDLVARCFDSFYLLLSHDVRIARPERLEIYSDLLSSLQSLRAEVRSTAESITGSSDLLSVIESNSAQSRLRYKISEYLDALQQADLALASIQEGTLASESPGESAM